MLLKFDDGIVQIYPMVKHEYCEVIVLELGPKLDPYPNTHIVA
jgi:hypothetical protein